MSQYMIINNLLIQNHDRVEDSEQPPEKPPTVAFYVDVKKKLNSKSGLKERVDKIVTECAAQKDPADLSPDIGVDEVVPCFQIVDVESPKSLMAWLQSEELQMTVSMSNVAVIVIDSLSTLVSQSPPEDGDYEGFIINLTTLLRSLAESCDCPVIITTTVPPGDFVHEQDDTKTFIRDTYCSTFPLSPTLQHCVQARHVPIFNNDPNPTVPPLVDTDVATCYQRCGLGAQRVAHFDLDSIGELLKLGVREMGREVRGREGGRSMHRFVHQLQVFDLIVFFRVLPLSIQSSVVADIFLLRGEEHRYSRLVQNSDGKRPALTSTE